jgi:hypothetical protein
MVMKLRQKDEEYESLEKSYSIQQQNLNFIRATSDQNVNELLREQQDLRGRIHSLEHQLA